MITSTHLNYTCQLSSIFHHFALERSGNLQPDISGLQVIIDMIRNKLNVGTDILRPMLLEGDAIHRCDTMN